MRLLSYDTLLRKHFEALQRGTDNELHITIWIKEETSPNISVDLITIIDVSGGFTAMQIQIAIDMATRIIPDAI